MQVCVELSKRNLIRRPPLGSDKFSEANSGVPNARLFSLGKWYSILDTFYKLLRRKRKYGNKFNFNLASRDTHFYFKLFSSKAACNYLENYFLDMYLDLAWNLIRSDNARKYLFWSDEQVNIWTKHYSETGKYMDEIV